MEEEKGGGWAGSPAKLLRLITTYRESRGGEVEHFYNGYISYI